MIAKSRFSDRSVEALKHRNDRYEVTEPGRTSLSIRVAAAPSTLNSPLTKSSLDEVGMV